MTDVVAALIWDGDKFLACQRPAHKTRGLLWEFVGGKVEPGESKEAALIRECREELDVTVSVENVFMEVVHEYPDLTVRLTLFNARIVCGTPKLLEHNQIRWITTSQIDALDFCPADVDILERLKTVQNSLQARLLSLADPQYKSFQMPLMPTVDPETMIGVRMPALRRIASTMDAAEAKSFMAKLPHRLFEENALHGILISRMKDPKAAIEELDRFLPFVDNWAVCDLITPKAFRSRPKELLPAVYRWIASSHPYVCRYAVGVLMKFYLDEQFRAEQAELVAFLRTDAYYVKMMQAWYLATAMAKQYASVIPILQSGKMDPWTQNKAIQKAIESYRVSADRKSYLRSLKIHSRKEGHV